MVRILDRDEYERRLDQTVQIPVGEEIGLLVKGFFTGMSSALFYACSEWRSTGAIHAASSN
jgi:hypothetical protein